MFSASSPTALFCGKDCVQAIDNFFDDLKLDNAGNPWVEKVRFGDAFMFFDTDNRFAYKGSASIPSCAKNWMRDICMTIYPIKQKHVDQFRNTYLAKNADTKWDAAAGTGGNYRNT